MTNKYNYETEITIHFCPAVRGRMTLSHDSCPSVRSPSVRMSVMRFRLIVEINQINCWIFLSYSWL